MRPDHVIAEFDPSVCEAGPVHSPGAIQPHGAFLAALIDGLPVTHASANLLSILGRPAEAVLGRALEEAIGEAACQVLCSEVVGDCVVAGRAGDGSVVGDRLAVRPMYTIPGGMIAGRESGRLHLRPYLSGRHICVDIVPEHPAEQQVPAVTMLQSILETFKHASTCQELCELAVSGLHAISGFDRVIAYRFAADEHGEVIAEARVQELEPFLGLHYPAADVPPQARALFLRNRVAAVADFAYQPVALLADPALDDGRPLDLTHSSLRSVSPCHREYMGNMKTAASLTVGLTAGHGEDTQRLWGMLVCHHATPRTASLDVRAVAGTIGQVVSLLVRSLDEGETYSLRLARQATLRVLVERLASGVPLLDGLASAGAELLDLVEAGGAVVRFSGQLLTLGCIPPLPAAERALGIVLADAGGAMMAIDDLGPRHPELRECIAAASGALVLPLSQSSDDAIVWFRPERSVAFDWGGNPAEQALFDRKTGRHSPRGSFAAWTKTQLGRSAPWTEADLGLARDLLIYIEAAIAKRNKAELDHLRDHDALTGLPNRNLLQERLRQAESEPGKVAALLFLALDRTQAIEDINGYAAGDALLAEVGRRLLVAAGIEHFAARMGGDEFVVLCRGLDRSGADVLGEQIRHAIEAPFEIGGQACRVSASVGIAIVDQSGGLDPVHAADMAMYAAMATIGSKQKAEAQRQKMEALGRMMGGVAHEINNMLQPVALLAQDLIDSGLVTEHGRTHAETVIDCTQRARQIIGDLLAFSRPESRATELHDPVELLHDSMRLVRQAIASSLTIGVRVEGRPPHVTINRTTFVQILLNLSTNASAAMQGQGELTILLDAQGHGSTAGAEFARLRVIDTGCGMDKTTLDRAFEPFFTTKPVGQGTGLGLPVVYGMVREMGGTISLDSHPGRGTTVTILIPGHGRTM